MDFKNKVALIVGASSGMGRTLALRLAAEGAQVVATARRRDKLDTLAAEIAAQGGRCLALAADAQDPGAAEQLVQDTVQQLGRSEPLDYLFPRRMAWLVRLSLLLPKRWTTRILRSEVPPMPAAARPTA